MAENQLWKWLKPYCPQGHYTRVENGDVGPGTPDVNYRLLTQEGWIELKDARYPTADIPFPNEKHGIRRTQLRWIADHVFFGATVWIVARAGDEIFFIHGKNVAAVNGATRKRLRSLSVYVLRDKPNVRKIRSMLTGEDNG